MTNFDNTTLMLRTATVRLRKYEKRYLANTKSIFYRALVEKTAKEISELKKDGNQTKYLAN